MNVLKCLSGGKVALIYYGSVAMTFTVRQYGVIQLLSNVFSSTTQETLSGSGAIVIIGDMTFRACRSFKNGCSAIDDCGGVGVWSPTNSQSARGTHRRLSLLSPSTRADQASSHLTQVDELVLFSNLTKT